MLRYAFRLHRWGMIGYGVVLFVSTYIQAAAFMQVAGTTAASRAAFARSMSALAAQLSYILPQPFRLDTLAGYVQWRAYGPLALVVTIWAMAAAAGAVRGDEDKQLVDYWRTKYDWRAHERELNKWPHFKVTIDGQRIHYIHQRGKGPKPLPLIISHGWPRWCPPPA